jgi:hypothetical protein
LKDAVFIRFIVIISFIEIDCKIWWRVFLSVCKTKFKLLECERRNDGHRFYSIVSHTVVSMILSLCQRWTNQKWDLRPQIVAPSNIFRRRYYTTTNKLLSQKLQRAKLTNVHVFLRHYLPSHAWFLRNWRAVVFSEFLTSFQNNFSVDLFNRLCHQVIQ